MLTLPASADVQFVPGTGKLFIDRLIDPSGKPLDVLDIDVGFTVVGHIELPGSLSGKGVVRLVADEIGGPFDGELGHVDLPITGSTLPTDPPVMKYMFAIRVTSPTLPDVSKMYQLGLIFILNTQAGGHTDIGGFYDMGAFLVV